MRDLRSRAITAASREGCIPWKTGYCEIVIYSMEPDGGNDMNWNILNKSYFEPQINIWK